jgi:hypothetical protein
LQPVNCVFVGCYAAIRVIEPEAVCHTRKLRYEKPNERTQ